MVTTLEALNAHIKQPDANNFVVVGPYIGDYKLLSPKELECFRLKGLVKSKDTFRALFYEKILLDTTALSAELKVLDPWIKRYYMQNVNALDLDPQKITYLKGEANRFKCARCHKEIKNLETNDGLCPDCGGLIRPRCLLNNEKYDLELLKTFDKDLLEATTIFLVGFNFNEIELSKQLEAIGSAKKLGDARMPVIVVVGECDKEGIFDVFYPEFIVDERPEGALRRLNQQINKQN